MTAGLPTDGEQPSIDGSDQLSPPGPDLTPYQCPECGGVGVGGGEMRCCGEAMEPVDPVDPVEKPELADILRDVFGMSETGLRICIELMRDGPQTAEEIATTLDIDSSFANRLLNHLLELEVIEERAYLLEGGGRVSRYSHATIPDVEESFKRELAVWVVTALQIIDEDIVDEKRAALESAHELTEELDDESIYYEP